MYPGSSTALVKEFFDSSREWFELSLKSKKDSIAICREHSQRVSSLVHELFERANPENKGRAVIVALGGLGREEQGLYSDIDLMFLHDGGEPDELKKLTDGILYPFWNNHIEASGAARTIDENFALAKNDLRVLTTLLETKFIAGDRSLYLELCLAVGKYFSNLNNLRRFVAGKIEERRTKLSRFADSIYLLEPNVKEGRGGLRDFHLMAWLAKAQNHDEEFSEMIRSFEFIWRARHALHLTLGKRTDRLTLTIQPDVARVLGFEGNKTASPAEEMMSSYHRHAANLHFNSARAVERMRRKVNPPGRIRKLVTQRKIGKKFARTEYGTFLALQPETLSSLHSILECFLSAKRAGLALDIETKDAVKGFAGRFVCSTAQSPDEGTRDFLRSIFSDPKNLSRTLLEMQECGALSLPFPEMGPLFYHVQHGGLHSFTIGVHSINCTAEIENLLNKEKGRAFPIEKEALLFVRRMDVLLLSAFLHDIGKGKDSDHTLAGSKIIADAANRLGFSSEDRDDMVFLVRSHLLMASLAFRRDVNDRALIERFAQTVKSADLLSMLYLITFADVRAVAPCVWSRWKDSLLSELYLKTMDCLKGGEKNPEGEAKRRTAAVGRFLAKDITEIRAFLSSLPERYLFSIEPETIASHIIMSREIPKTQVSTLLKPFGERGCHELSVVTHDKPGLFAKIAGVITANGANIVDAQIYTNAKGLVIDIFRITDTAGKFYDDPARLGALQKELSDVITEKTDIKKIVEARFKPSILSGPGGSHKTEVVVDNDVSAVETVVEVNTADRQGLLYTIARTLFEIGCTIERARITTIVDRATDVFYIKSAGGGKIESRGRLAEIQKRLIGALGE